MEEGEGRALTRICQSEFLKKTLGYFSQCAAECDLFCQLQLQYVHSYNALHVPIRLRARAIQWRVRYDLSRLKTKTQGYQISVLIIACVFLLARCCTHIISSPEPKTHRRAYSIWRYPSSFRRPSVVRLSTFSNDISSEAVRPILFIFHIWHL